MNNKFFTPLAPLVLPAVYDDVLSYEEYLSKVVHQLNELTDYLNTTMDNLYKNIDIFVKADVAKYMQEITDRINDINATLSGRIDDLQAELDDIDTDKVLADAKAYTDSKIAQTVNDINGDLAQLRGLIAQGIVECKQYTDDKARISDAKINAIDAKVTLQMQLAFADMNARIDTIIREFPRVYDPATGYMETMDEAIIRTYCALRTLAISALKYDDQEMTAEEYDAMNLKAIKYDIEMLRILFSDLREMFNPFTGKEESVRDVVDYLIRLLKWNAKTATEYDGYQATASEFDASTFNAYAQDTNQYITGTTPDTKNKAYENYLLLTAELTDGNSVNIPANAYGIRFELADRCFTIPSDDVNITIDGVTVSASNSELSVTNGNLENVFAITPVKDVSELDN